MKAALVLVSLSLICNAQDDWRRALDRANGLRLTDPSGARREFQNAEHLAKQVGGESLVLVWIDFSEFLIQQDDYREAEAVLRNALAVHDQTTKDWPIQRAIVLQGLAVTRLALGRPEESIELLRTVISLLDGAAGVDHDAILPALNLLSSLYLQTGRMGDARVTIHRALGLAKRIGKGLDRSHTWIALSEFERIVGNHDGARRAARNALKLVGPATPDNARFFEGVHNQLARIAYETSNYKLAASHWKLALNSLNARRPDTDEEVLYLRADIARVAVVDGHLQEAEEELLAVARLAEDHGRQIALGLSLYGLGVVYAEQKRFDKAIPILVRSLAITDEKFGQMSPQSAACVADLAKSYLKARQPVEAEKFSRRAASVTSRDHAVALVWLGVMQIHAQVLEKLNRKAEAKEVHERASRLVASRRIRNQTIDVMDLVHR
jgi:tetratricopeptide (TPR) repeat protein